MNVKKILIGVVMSVSLIVLVGCKEGAIGKIVGYIQYGVDEPTIELFQEAEIMGVNEGNIDCINAGLEALSYLDVSGGNVLEVGENIQEAVYGILDEEMCFGEEPNLIDSCVEECGDDPICLENCYGDFVR